MRACKARLILVLSLVALTGSSLLPPLRAAQQQPAAADGLKIVVLEGEDGVNIIQKKTAVSSLVEVRDKNNLPIAGVIVTFVILDLKMDGSAVFANGAKELSLTTDAAGRASISNLRPVSKGAFQIQARATYHGQVATTTIHQTNFATVADAAKAGKAPGSQGSQSSANSSGSGNAASTGAGSGAGGSGGMSTLALASIGAAAAGATVATVAVVKNRNQPPSLSAVTASPTTGLQGGTVISFSAQGSDPDGDQLSYAWDFGDGSTSTASTPTHTYSSPGTFTTTVKLSDGKASVSNQTSVTIKTVTGTWRSNTVAYSQGTIQFTLSITQSGTGFTGTIQGLHVAGPAGSNNGSISSGSIRTSSPHLTFVTSLSGWSAGSMTFTLEPSADINSMSGTASDTTGTSPTLVFSRQ